MESPKLRFKLRPDQVAGLKRVAAARGVDVGALMPEILRSYKTWQSQEPIRLQSLSTHKSEPPEQARATGEALVSDALDWWLALPQNRPV